MEDLKNVESAKVKSQIVSGYRRYYAIAEDKDVLYIGTTRREVERWLRTNGIKQIKRNKEQ